MNKAELISTSSFLTKYFDSEPIIMVNEEGNGDSVISLHWTYMLNDVTGHPALAVMLDTETDTLIIEEAEGYSFHTEARLLLKGFAIEHGLEFLISAVHVDGSGTIDDSPSTESVGQLLH